MPSCAWRSNCWLKFHKWDGMHFCASFVRSKDSRSKVLYIICVEVYCCTRINLPAQSSTVSLRFGRVKQWQVSRFGFRSTKSLFFLIDQLPFPLPTRVLFYSSEASRIELQDLEGSSVSWFAPPCEPGGSLIHFRLVFSVFVECWIARKKNWNSCSGGCKQQGWCPQNWSTI